MERTQLSDSLPALPPDELIGYCQSHGFLTENALIYRAEYIRDPLTGEKRKYVKVTCSKCGGTVYCEYTQGRGGCSIYSPAPFGFIHPEYGTEVWSGDTTVCPDCGAEAKAYHIGSFSREKEIGQCTACTVCEASGRLAVMYWYIKKTVEKDARARIYAFPDEAYLFDGKKCLKFRGWQKYISSITFFDHWEQLKQCTVTEGTPDIIYPYKADVLKRTGFENSHLKRYTRDNKCYPVSFLRLWQKHKNAENLLLAGFGRFLTEGFDKSLSYNGYYGRYTRVTGKIEKINWKAVRPAQMLNLNRSELKVMKKEQWSYSDWLFYIEARENLPYVRAEDLKTLTSYDKYTVQKFYGRNENIFKAARYIDKQKNRYPGACPVPVFGTLTDYWDMAARLGDDMKDSAVLWPQNLNAAHDLAVRRTKFEESKKLIPFFEKRRLELEKYGFTDGKLLIRACESEQELIREGKILHHCVARYADSHAHGKTSIFFIRRAEAPETPYYTLEFDISSQSVRQNRGLENCDRTPEVEQFEYKWLEYVSNLGKEKKNGKHDGKRKQDTRKTA